MTYYVMNEVGEEELCCNWQFRRLKAFYSAIDDKTIQLQ